MSYSSKRTPTARRWMVAILAAHQRDNTPRSISALARDVGASNEPMRLYLERLVAMGLMQKQCSAQRSKYGLFSATDAGIETDVAEFNPPVDDIDSQCHGSCLPLLDATALMKAMGMCIAAPAVKNARRVELDW